MEEGNLAGPSYTQHAAAGHVCYGEPWMSMSTNRSGGGRHGGRASVGDRRGPPTTMGLSDVGCRVCGDSASLARGTPFALLGVSHWIPARVIHLADYVSAVGDTDTGGCGGRQTVSVHRGTESPSYLILQLARPSKHRDDTLWGGEVVRRWSSSIVRPCGMGITSTLR